MARSLAHVALIVRDYDEAIAWYREKLGFTLVADEAAQDKRWVLVAPPGSPPGGASLLLARLVADERLLLTDDFDRDFAAMTAKGVAFVRPPAVQPYGKVAVFLDLYGNRWDLVQFADA